jgi:dynein heavy chain
MLAGEQQVSTVWLQCVFLFCLVWGLGSTLTLEGQQSFDVFYRKVLNGESKRYPKPKSFKLSKAQLFPERAVVFEWIYDKRNNGTWISWLDTVDKVQQIPANAKPSELIIQTNQSCCQRFFLKLYQANRIPLLFVGPTGTGKTAVVLDHLVNLSKDKFLPNVVNFSARTTSMMVIFFREKYRTDGVFVDARDGYVEA